MSTHDIEALIDAALRFASKRREDGDFKAAMVVEELVARIRQTLSGDLAPLLTQALASDLIGTAEIAVEKGVSKQAVCNWRSRHADFPRPIISLTCGDLFSRREVNDWYRNHAWRAASRPTEQKSTDEAA